MKKSNIALASLITISAIIIPKLIENLKKSQKIGKLKEEGCEQHELEDDGGKKEGDNYKKEVKNKNDNTVRVHNSLVNINIKIF